MIGDDIIRSALTKLGVLPIGEAVPTEWTALALYEFNGLVQLWAVDGLVPTLTEGTFSLVSSQAVYTIGASGNFNVRRPMEIADADVTLSGATTPLAIYLSMFRYDSYPTHPVGVPKELYWDPINTQGKIAFYPTPDGAYSLHMRSVTSLAPLAASTEAILLPPEYETFLSTNLAKHLMPVFGKTDPLIIEQAKTSMTAIQRFASRRYLRAVGSDPSSLRPGAEDRAQAPIDQNVNRPGETRTY